MKTKNFESFSIGELQERMKVFGARAMHLCGRTPDGQPLGQQVKKFFDELLDSTKDPAKIAARDEFLNRALTDPVARQQFCAIRVETLNNYILATVNIMPMFFEVVNLADDERPVVQNTTDQEIKVSYVGADGGVKQIKVVKEDDEFLVNLHYLTTDKVTYRRVDIYRGTIIDAALKTLRLAYDLKNQMDKKCYDLLTANLNAGGVFGTFRYYGDGGSALPKRSNYTFLPNSRIDPANLPTTNDITLAGNTSSTLFRYQAFRAAIQYVAQWAGAFPEGDLMLTGKVLIPGKDIEGIAESITPEGSTRNRVADELLDNGWTKIRYLGHDFELHADNTLPAKQAYFEMNRKPGRVYLKPSQDREQVIGEQDYNLNVTNEEQRWSQKVFGAYINSALRMNVLRIRYAT